MLNDRAAVSEHTSQQYSGCVLLHHSVYCQLKSPSLISIHDQNCSWAAKWLRKSASLQVVSDK